jgi:Carboxypeptidase regulatory-like domain
VFIVGTVCSAATGRPTGGATVVAEPAGPECAQGHQPWRCSTSAVSDAEGHYGVSLFGPDGYRLTIERAGHRAGGDVVDVARPGVVKANWTLMPN